MGQVWLARDERSGLDVALKIVAREGKSSASRRARGPRGRGPPPPTLPAHLRARPRSQPRLHRLRVRPRPDDAPGAARRRARRPPARSRWPARSLEALAHAHGRGIIHRDVKPSNVLLAESDGIDVRLLDFGLAQMAEFDTLTALGDVPGTLAYVSPERLLGKTATRRPTSGRVGVMLWESLAGEHPFREAILPETSRAHPARRPAARERCAPTSRRAAAKPCRSALVLNPARRPSAGSSPDDLREPAAETPAQGSGGSDRNAARGERGRVHVSAALRDRLLPGALAASATGWVADDAAVLPVRLAARASPLAAATLGLAAPRAGLAFVLASVGPSRSRTSRWGWRPSTRCSPSRWLALSWSDARSGLLARDRAAARPLRRPRRCCHSRRRSHAALCDAPHRPRPGARWPRSSPDFRHVPLPFATQRPRSGSGSPAPSARAQSPRALAGAPRPSAVLGRGARARLRNSGFLYLARTAARGLPPRSARRSWPRPRSSHRRPPSLPLIGAAWLTAAALALEPSN